MAESYKKRAVFLDRDGTLIIDKVYLNDPDQIEYLPHLFKGLKIIQAAGYEFIVVTNQSGVARGLVSVPNLFEIHRRIAERFLSEGIAIRGFYSAPFEVESGHDLRKPSPGMLKLAAREHIIDLTKSWMIGDQITDVEAGRRAGARSILLQNSVPTDKNQKGDYFVAPHLLAAAEIILAG